MKDISGEVKNSQVLLSRASSPQPPRHKVVVLKPAIERVFSGETKPRLPERVTARRQGGPDDLLIFGSPKGGTPLMQSAQTIGIDLPLRALVWEDAKGHVWLSYNDPAWVAQRHAGAAGMQAAVQTMTGALNAIAAEATSAAPKK
jgi:hypothetical protein